MKNSRGPRNATDSPVSRRKFLAQATAASVGLSIVPRHVLGGLGYVPPSDKLNLAFIGVGAQGMRVMLHFLKEPDVQGIAVCDVNKSGSNYPQWSTHEFCNSVRGLLGVSSGWDWLSPDDPIQLSHTLKVTGGVAGREPAQKIVDAYNATGTRSGNSRGCAAYSDYRELLDKENDLDAVVVCTADHLHAAISAAAMRKHKHVFCQNGVATQIAVGNQASEDTRLLCEWIWAGAIGPVREVHNWSSRPFWPQGIDRPAASEPVPDGLDWDLWLGPSPARPYNHVYLPFSWRGWADFGCGALGDMGCYSFDTIFRVLKLEAPSSVEASSTDRYPETYPNASLINFNFPQRGDMPPVKFTWYDGGLKPPRPEELEADRPFTMEGEDGEEGLLFVGDKGKILCGFNGAKPRLIPDAKMKAFQPPPNRHRNSFARQRRFPDRPKIKMGSRQSQSHEFRSRRQNRQARPSPRLGTVVA